MCTRIFDKAQHMASIILLCRSHRHTTRRDAQTKTREELDSSWNVQSYSVVSNASKTRSTSKTRLDTDRLFEIELWGFGI